MHNIFTDDCNIPVGNILLSIIRGRCALPTKQNIKQSNH